MMNINERENDSQNRYVRISILDNDVCMIMKQYENDVKYPNVKMQLILPKCSTTFRQCMAFLHRKNVQLGECDMC